MKREIRSNYRLEILADTRSLRASVLTDHNRMLDVLSDMDAAVRRHVDNVGGLTHKWDTREECSHCGYAWEALTVADLADPELGFDEESVEGEPVCCEAAVAEFRAERSNQSSGGEA